MERFFTQISRGTASRFGTLVADIFGSGDQLLDAQARLDGLIARRGLLLESSGGLITEGVKQLDLQIRQAESERNLLNFQQFRIEAQKKLTQEIRSTNSALLEEVQATAGQRLRVPGSPQTLDDIFLDDAEKQAEEFLERSERLRITANQQLELATNETLKLSTDAFTRQFEFESNAQEQLYQNKEYWRNFDLQQQQAQEDKMFRIKQQGLIAAHSLLTAYGGKYRKFAQTLLAFEKAKAIANIVVETHEAATRAFKWGTTINPALGYAAAAAAIAFGAARVAAVASTVIGSNNSPQLGSSGNPISTVGPDTSFQSEERPTASSQSAVQVIFQGPIYNTDDFQRSIVDALKEVSDRDVVIFNNQSAQAQVIRG